MNRACHKPRDAESVQQASIKTTEIESSAYSENFLDGLKNLQNVKGDCQTAFSASQCKWTLSSTLKRVHCKWNEGVRWMLE